MNNESTGENMREKIEAALRVAGFMVPQSMRKLLIDVGTEIDRLRSDVSELRSKLDDGK